jgi:hypothetical protein
MITGFLTTVTRQFSGEQELLTLPGAETIYQGNPQSLEYLIN